MIYNSFNTHIIISFYHFLDENLLESKKMQHSLIVNIVALIKIN